ncbi:MAG: ATP-binding protein [Candidatus Brocadiales bacterium]
MKAFQSFRSRLLIFGLCISLIPIATISAVYYFNAKLVIKKKTLNWLMAVAESRKAHVLAYIEEESDDVVDASGDVFIINTLETIARGGTPTDDAITALNTHLSGIRALDHDIIEIFVVDPEGKVVGCTSGTMIGKDMSDNEFFLQGLRLDPGKSYVDHPRHLPYFDTNSIPISAPIFSRRSDDIIGIIIYTYYLTALDEITTRRAALGATGEVLLGQREGDNIVFLTSLRHASNALLSKSIPVDASEAEPMRLALEGRRGALIAPDYRSVAVIAAYQYIPALHCGLVAKIDKAEAFAPVKNLGIVVMLLGVSGAAMVTVIGIVFAFATSRPVKKLTAAAEKFASGDLSYRVKVARTDEIGELADSFNAMASGLAEEITERKRTEEELRKQREHLEKLANELAATNKELEAFSYSVSHDLRAPLRGIDGFSKALLEDYTDKLDPQGRDYLQRVRVASQRMGQLIEDLLNLSRITRSEMRHEEVNLSAIAKTVAAELQEMQPERQVEFVIAEGVVAQGDERLLQVALNNLLNNAWKFTIKRPRARIEFGVTRHEGKLAYFVRDNGAGFDMAYADKLFGAFQRLHKPSEFEGTGIGLAIVQRIIHRHGGRVWAEGAVEKGATFYFTL